MDCTRDIYIVTFKYPRDANHNPADKKTASCPCSFVCTDSTGAHHSMIVQADSVEDIRSAFNEAHITRIELALPMRVVNGVAMA